MTKKHETGSSPAVVSCRSVGMQYRSLFGRHRVKALTDFNLDVSRQEIVGVLGPNGSGKTTLFKILLGLIRPAPGEVRLFGSRPTSAQVKQRIGFMPEENYFHPYLTLKATLGLHGRLQGLGRGEIRERTERLIDKFDLETFTGPIRSLSKGTVRKLALAQALIGDPQLLLLDEPTSGVDPVASEMVKTEILERCERGATVILASHLLSDVEQLCDRIVVLYRGETICAGRTEDLLTRKEELQIRVRGLPEAARRKLRSIIESEGGEVVSAGPPRENLLEFFMNLLGR